ncbi:rna-directed dna polymerase from mobile element jockey-like [Pitangus sulphuratus]|nr:rna-directed dna polymerase from mobile element jockey-like [Pitangus sulphuratus]
MHKVLRLGRNNPRQQYRLRADLLESSSAEKNLGALVDNKLSMNQQCVFVVRKASGILGCIRKSIGSRLRVDPGPLLSSTEATSGVLCPVLGSSVQERHGLPGLGAEGGNKDDEEVGASLSQGKAERARVVQSGEEMGTSSMSIII